MERKKLKKIIQRVSEFPTLPTVIARVMQVMDDPYSSASDLTDIIKLDQAMMFRLLKMANSAYYGFPRSIATVTESVVLLGFSTVRNLILTTMMYQFDQLWKKSSAKGDGPQEFYFDQKQEWKHSVATAVATRELLIVKNLVVLENFGYLAGLMHDMGKILYFQYMQEDYRPVLKECKIQKKRIWDLEMEMIGADHGQVGSWIVDRWNLPEDIVTPIAYHHQPHKAKDHKELTMILHYADILAHVALKDRNIGREFGAWREDQINDLGLEDEAVDQLLEKIVEELQHIETFMDI